VGEEVKAELVAESKVFADPVGLAALQPQSGLSGPARCPTTPTDLKRCQPCVPNATTPHRHTKTLVDSSFAA
jgi:hypothetical protein